MGWVYGVVTLVALAAAGGGAYAARGYRRRRLAAAIVAMSAAAHRPVLGDVVVQVIAEDTAIRRLEADLRRLVPEPPASATGLESFFMVVERNSLKAAGLEQIALNLIDMPDPDPAVLSVAVQHLGDVLPEHLREAGATILRYLHSAEFGESLREAASEALREALKDFGHSGTEFVEAIAHRSAGQAFAVVGEALGSGALDGTVSLVGDVLRSDAAAEVAGHLLAIGDSIGEVSVADGVDAHFPVFTAIISTVREAKLLDQGKTTFDRSLLNVGLDVAGTGIGGVAGGKAGAAIGTAIAPGPGTVIGAIVGAVAGAMAGKAVTNELKYAKLHRAQAEYRTRLDAHPARLKELADTLTRAVTTATGTERDRYLRELPAAPELDAACADLAVRYASAAREQVAAARRLAARARKMPDPSPELVAALAVLDTLLSTVDDMLCEDDLAVLVAAPVPVHPMLGRRYEQTCRDLARELSGYADRRRQAVARWSAESVGAFAERADALKKAVTPAVDTYKRGRDSADAHVKAAEREVRKEKDALNL